MQFMGEFYCLSMEVVGAFPEETVFQSSPLLPHLILQTIHFHPLLTDVLLHEIHQLIGDGLSTISPSPAFFPQCYQQSLQFISHPLRFSYYQLTQDTKTHLFQLMEVGAFVLFMEVCIEPQNCPFAVYAVSEVLTHAAHHLRPLNRTLRSPQSILKDDGRVMNTEGVTLRMDCHYPFPLL